MVLPYFSVTLPGCVFALFAHVMSAFHPTPYQLIYDVIRPSTRLPAVTDIRELLNNRLPLEVICIEI